MGRRGRRRRFRPIRNAVQRFRNRRGRGGGQQQAPAPAPASLPEAQPQAAPDQPDTQALQAAMTASGPPNPAAEAPQTLPVQAARALVGGDAPLNAMAAAGDTAISAGQDLQQAGQERQENYGEGGALRVEGQEQKQFGPGEDQPLNPMDAPGRWAGDQVIGGINKAQELYGQAQEGIGNLAEGAGNLYNQAIGGAGRAYDSLAETVQGLGASAADAGAEAGAGIVDAGRQAGEAVGEAIRPITDAGASAGRAAGEALYADQNERLAQPASNAEVQARIAKTEQQKRPLPTPVNRGRGNRKNQYVTQGPQRRASGRKY